MLCCAQCRQLLDESADGADGTRAPCPKCGSSARAIHAGIIDLNAAPSDVVLGMHARGPKRRRTPTSKLRHVREVTFYLGPSAKDGVRRRVVRTFDGDAELYIEHISDEATGDLFRLLVEPLSCHRGRGSAKRKTHRSAYDWAIDTLAYPPSSD